MRRRNIIAACVLIALSIGYGILTSQLPLRSLPDTPGPPFFPWINTVVLIALSLGLLASGVFGSEQPAEGRVEAGARRRAWAALGVILAYLIILPGLGFIVATIPFFAAMMVLFGEKRPMAVIAGAVGMSVGLYLLFRHGFGVFLPRGIAAGLIDGLFA